MLKTSFVDFAKKGGTLQPLQRLNFSSLSKSLCIFTCNTKLLTPLTHPFPHFYIVFKYYWTCFSSGYIWYTTRWTLANNQLLIYYSLDVKQLFDFTWFISELKEKQNLGIHCIEFISYLQLQRFSIFHFLYLFCSYFWVCRGKSGNIACIVSNAR
jgi:hypothetical protein